MTLFETGANDLAKKLRVGVIFGGRSGEHEVSLQSAKSVIDAMDRDKYEVVPIGITPEGRWLTSSDATLLLPEAVVRDGDREVAIFGDPTRDGLVRLDAASGDARTPLDVVFPVLHGTFGEDGTIQGLLELAGLPYVGSGVLGSAAGMDKAVMKALFREAGLPIVEHTFFLRTQWDRDRGRILDSVEAQIGYPAFAKPANLGSSVGISKATDRASLERALDTAARFDRKIIVERGVDGREVEVAVLGNDEPVASLPGEIIPNADFYDFDTKYTNDTAEYAIPAELSPEQTAEVQEMAIRAFRAVDAAGLGRVDFFVERAGGRILLNEINTMPGFTRISMYPKLWEASGIRYRELIDRLIELAVDRHREQSRSQTTRQ
jgi:D-alanine-D-alanine ligase